MNKTKGGVFLLVVYLNAAWKMFKRRKMIVIKMLLPEEELKIQVFPSFFVSAFVHSGTINRNLDFMQ